MYRSAPGAKKPGLGATKVQVLRDSPYRRFYEKNGGTLLEGEETIKIADMELVHVAYGWRRLPRATE